MLGTGGRQTKLDRKDNRSFCASEVPVRCPAPVSPCTVVFPDSGISAYATILQLGKLRPEKLNHPLIITHSLWVWRR